MVNTEHDDTPYDFSQHYNILNIVVNTEQMWKLMYTTLHYNILNIVVNTEPLF